MFNPAPRRRSAHFYRVHADLQVERLALPPAGVGNSIAFSPDGAHDVLHRLADAARSSASTTGPMARLGDAPVFVRLRRGEGFADGSAVDADGGLWNAQWRGRCVVRCDAEGRESARLEVPASRSTCPAFGGAALDQLYVTTARVGLSAADLQAQPEAGGVFVLQPGLARPSGSALRRFGLCAPIPTKDPMTATTAPRYQGLFPVVPTTFTETGALDLDSQKRCVDFMIDAGSDGLCILANFSEQFLLADDEREVLTRTILEHVAGRVPVIVTTTHFSTAGLRRAQPARPGHGRRDADGDAALPRRHLPRVGEPQIHEFYARLSDAIDIPIMIQDAPAAGTPLSAAFLARMAKEIEHVAYFKIETAGAAAKLRELIRLGGDAIEGPWDGEEAITLLPDLEAGATGAMTGGGFPDGIRPILDAYRAGRRDEAIAAYERWLPLINIENRQCGLAGRQVADEGRRRDRLRGAAPSLPARSSRQPARC